MMSHTPGPWKVAENLFGNTASYEVYANVETKSGKGGYTRICQITPRDQKDNAALIAAAPEMLAILEELRESSTCCGTYDLLDETTWASPDLADRIESAIRKARGGE